MKEDAMNCKGTGELLTAYLDGEVTEKEKALVESHLPDCPQCRAEMETLKVTQAGLKSVLTAMADEAAPSSGAWKNIRAKIEKKDGWLENLGNIMSNQKWQGVAITAMVVVVAVSVTIWQISGAGQSRSLVAPAPAPVPGSVPAPTTPTTTPPPAQVTVNTPSVTVPAPPPTPAPTAPPVPTPGVPPPPTTPPVATAPPPNTNVGAPPPPQVTVQSPPPAAVVIQAPPPSTIWTINATSITASSAILTGRLNYLPSGIEVAFEYGTTAEFGNRSTYIPMSAIGDFSALITGLEPYTTYHYRAVGRRVGINDSYEAGGTGTFITYPQPLTVSSTAINVPRPASTPATDTPLKAPLWFWFLLTVALLAAAIIIFFSGRRAKV